MRSPSWEGEPTLSPASARVVILPAEDPTIGDSKPTRVDSVAVFKAPDHVLVQARRVSSTEHPCWDGGDYAASELGEFVVLRGNAPVQAFTVEAKSEHVSHDDVDGDAGVTVGGTLVAQVGLIRLRSQVDEWHESPSGGPEQIKHSVASAELRLEYSSKAGRYLPVK